MLLFEELNEDTFLLYAARNYYNPTCIDAEEFHEDLKRFKYLKRLIRRYQDGGKLSVNLILNHLVVIFNVFGIEPGLRMLDYKVLDHTNMHIVKPFLIYLNVVTNDKYTGTPMDDHVVEELRKI
jgi:hypothetical protein